MSAKLQVANRRGILLLAILFIGSCATAPSTVAPDTVYRSSLGGRTIVVSPSALVIGDVRTSLEDCSDAEYHCLRSDAGFYAMFPKVCPKGDWFPASGSPMKLVASYPHSRGGTYINRSSSKFAYDWDQAYGLVTIYYGAEVWSDFSNFPDSTRQKDFAYVRQGRSSLFSCRP